MPSKAATGAAKRARRKARAAQATITHSDSQSDSEVPKIEGEAIPCLPNHLVLAHILSGDAGLIGPADYARLRAVSSTMCDTVDAMGYHLEEPEMHLAAKVGCWLTLKRLHQQGHPKDDNEVCLAAAEGGRLDVLRCTRAEG